MLKQRFDLEYNRGDSTLQSYHRFDALVFYQGSQLLSLGQAGAQRPFDVDTFSLLDARLNGLVMQIYARAANNKIDLSVRDQLPENTQCSSVYSVSDVHFDRLPGLWGFHKRW